MDQSRPNIPVPFMKMHGLGNDFVVLDSRGLASRMNAALARAIADRNRGVGYDQLAEIRGNADKLILDFWNADGTRAEACGNATRCVAHFLMDEARSNAIDIETIGAKIKAVRNDDGQVSVNMGHPQLDWDQIPLANDVDPGSLPITGRPIALGMGNPHCVFFRDGEDDLLPERDGPEIEAHPLFPERTNVEFAHVRPDGTIRMRVWERGAGVTLACGSGACATAVAAHLRGLTGKSVRMELDGGWLTLDWKDDGVWMTGATAHVFSGELTPSFLASV